MDALKQQFDRIQQQLAALSATQRMLVMSLVALMVLTVLFWGRYAATPESVAVLEQSFQPEQAVQVVSELERQGIRATVAPDGRIMVPADRRMQAFAAVAYNRLLPANSSASVDKIVSQMTLWDSSAKTDKLWNEKKEVLLAQTIAQFPGVEEAVVRIDPAERRSFSAPSQPRAAINIRMRSGERGGRSIATAAADFVIGSQSGLARNNVVVVVDGISVSLPDKEADGGMAASDIISSKQAWERVYVDKLREKFANIPNVMLGVAVDLDVKRTQETRQTVDPKNTVQVQLESTSRNEESTLPAPASTDTGAVPNVAPSTPAAANGGSTISTNETNKFLADYGKGTIRTETPPGNATLLSASVSVPRSYLVQVYRQLNPKVTEVDEAALTQVATTELDRIRVAAMRVLGIKDRESITVDFYVDTQPEPSEAGSGASKFGVPVFNVVGSYGKEVALGVLALAALFMVSGIVKKGAGGVPATSAAAIAEQQRELERLAGGDEIVGAAAEGTATLEALELDEETSATQQMIQQVSNMVKDNPDAATALVKRWINRL